MTAGHTGTFTPIAAVSPDHYPITIAQALLAELIARNVKQIGCNGKLMHSGLMLPPDGNHLLTERFRLQTEATELQLKN